MTLITKGGLHILQMIQRLLTMSLLLLHPYCFHYRNICCPLGAESMSKSSSLLTLALCYIVTSVYVPCLPLILTDIALNQWVVLLSLFPAPEPCWAQAFLPAGSYLKFCCPVQFVLCILWLWSDINLRLFQFAYPVTHHSLASGFLICWISTWFLQGIMIFNCNFTWSDDWLMSWALWQWHYRSHLRRFD